MTDWARNAVFYHIYPLGFCGAPAHNRAEEAPRERLGQIEDWIGQMRGLGADALYLGPLFESSSHGYDTSDYFRVDRRLGSNADLARLTTALHGQGMRVVLDGVFHHVGRDFWAFRDVQARGRDSAYCDWFAGLRFDGRSPYGDPFAYDGWNGHYNLVKLNLGNPAVRQHLFDAVSFWVAEFAIDGLRLDAADCLDHGFLAELSQVCRRLRPDFWLLGEVIHGDYRHWAGPDRLDSVTNYECYKGLHSSHNERNYFEIAYSLNRQFGPDGIYRDLPLYAFADNHDVDRVASVLRDPAQLYPLHCLLFAMPGVPSIYYGSEWGVAGRKAGGDDGPLRPAREHLRPDHPDLARAIARLAGIRRSSAALRLGAYRQLHVNHDQLAFERRIGDEQVIVAVNGAESAASLELEIPAQAGRQLIDLLNDDAPIIAAAGRTRIAVPGRWARILAVR
ncbi:MAG TPA: alpha-amylase family glycosyl hydrolase [Herpetosiphonaceae bacterium]|nr:alpha-amylase family glycosyl hydrolase [Herpetosiphonaceae bacterium]